MAVATLDGFAGLESQSDLDRGIDGKSHDFFHLSISFCCSAWFMTFHFVDCFGGLYPPGKESALLHGVMPPFGSAGAGARRSRRVSSAGRWIASSPGANAP